MGRSDTSAMSDVKFQIRLCRALVFVVRKYLPVH
jgi:hypothetical protein